MPLRKADAKWLKSWFELTRYPEKELKALDLGSWGQQLEIRRHLLQRIEFPQVLGRADQWRNWLLRDIKETPLSLGGRMPRLNAGVPVADQTHVEIRAQQALCDCPGAREIIRSWDDEIGSLDRKSRVLKAILGGGIKVGTVRGVSVQQVILESLEAYEGPGESAVADSVLQIGYAAVDFSYSDETLITHFKQWVEKRRTAFKAVGIQRLAKELQKSEGKRPRVILSQKSMERWISMQVLPYLDIRIMASEAGLAVPSAAILAKSLFPKEKTRSGDAIDHKEKVGRLAQLAEQLIEPGTIDRLLLEGQAQLLGGKN